MLYSGILMDLKTAREEAKKEGLEADPEFWEASLEELEEAIGRGG